MIDVITGEQVYLSDPRPGDAETLAALQWNNDLIRMLSWDTYTPYSLEQWEEFLGSSDGKERFLFCIRLRKDDTFIGYTSISEIQVKNRGAEASIAIIDAEHRGKGYGLDAMETLLRYAFMELGLHKIRLSVNANNLPAVRTYERVGFVREGVDREALYQDNQWLDIWNYGLLKREWLEQHYPGAMDID